jgi:hypothetical protein
MLDQSLMIEDYLSGLVLNPTLLEKVSKMC